MCCGSTMFLSMLFPICLFIISLFQFSNAGHIDCAYVKGKWLLRSNCGTKLCDSEEDCVWDSDDRCYRCITNLDVIITFSVIGGIAIIVFIIWGGWCCYRYYYPRPVVVHAHQPVVMQTVPMAYGAPPQPVYSPPQPVYYSTPQPVMVRY